MEKDGRLVRTRTRRRRLPSPQWRLRERLTRYRRGASAAPRKWKRQGRTGGREVLSRAFSKLGQGEQNLYSSVQFRPAPPVFPLSNQSTERDYHVDRAF